MSTNAVEKVREAEQKAEQTEREATKRAQNIIDAAMTECERCIKAAKADGETEFKNAVDACTKTAEEESKKARLGFDGELDKLKTLAESKSSRAVELVKEKLISC
ncbi:MAG: hypothetical protein J6D15_06100 [Clostridia bacterium]|nr:hypothetical protein [Clostridia bacterium]